MADVFLPVAVPDPRLGENVELGLIWDDVANEIVGLYGENDSLDFFTLDIGANRQIIIGPLTLARQLTNIPPPRRPSFRPATPADRPWLQQYGFVPGFNLTVRREYTNPRRGSPTVSASSYTEFFGGATTSHSVPMPSTVDANDLLHVVFLNTGTSTVTASGFTDKGTATNTDRHSVFAKVAVGDEDSTNVDFVTSSGAFAIAHVRRIDDGSWLEDIDGVEVELATGTSATPDPPANTPSWGSSDTGWVAAGTKVSGTVTGAPTSYTDFVNGSAGDNMGSAFRANTTATENPGTFGGSTSSAYVASTTAIASDTATLPSSDVGNIASTALSGTSTSVTIPSHDSGDQLVMVLRVTASVTPMEDFPTITGWTEVSHGGVSGNAEAGNFSAVRVGIFEKTGNGSESSVTVGTWSNSIGGRATVFQLTNRGDIKDVVIVESDSNADIDIGAGSTDEDDTIAIWGFIADDDLSTEADHDSDASWQGTSVDYAEASTPGNGYATACAYAEDISSGTIPASTFSMNGDTDAGVAVMVAFGPAAAAGVTGSGAITESADTTAGAGGVLVQASGAITESADTTAGSGAVLVDGDTAITESADTVAGSGGVLVVGTGAIAEAVDVVAGAGTVTDNVITGSGAIAEAVDAVAGAGAVLVAGSVVITEVVDAVASAGTVLVSGSGSLTEVIDVVAGAGTVLVSGSGAITEAVDVVYGVHHVLTITALAHYQFRRLNNNLVLAPSGRSTQIGFKASEGWEKVSSVIRIDQTPGSEASAVAAMAAVASAWAAESGSAAATLQAAIHQDLHDAGFRDQNQGLLV